MTQDQEFDEMNQDFEQWLDQLHEQDQSEREIFYGEIKDGSEYLSPTRTAG